MQDRYAGDIGDYGKYGLLRWLCGADEHGPALTLGVLWYLVPHEKDNNDGGIIDYLDTPSAGLRECDPELFDKLSALVKSERSVAEVQRRRILPVPTVFVRAVTPTGAEVRRTWVEAGLSEVAGADLVFADPDNGLMGIGAGGSGDRSAKHAYYDELKPLWERGQSVVVYQHQTRLRGGIPALIADRARGFKEHFGGARGLMVLRWRRRQSRLYFVLPAPQHAERITARVSALIRSPWGQPRRRKPPHFELVEHE